MYEQNTDAPRRAKVLHSVWGQLKSDEQLDYFTRSILTAFPPTARTPACLVSTLATSHNLDPVLQQDTALAVSLGQWSRRGAPSLTPPRIRSDPLDSGIAILQIFEHAHFTNLITDGTSSYIYDSLGTHSNTPTCLELLNRLGNFYQTHRPNMQPPSLLDVEAVRGPKQCDSWSCGMFMISTSLASIYQHAAPPTLPFRQAHMYQLHRAQLTYLLTGELIPWVGRFVRYLTDPQNEDYRIAAEPPVNPSAGGLPLAPPAQPPSRPSPPPAPPPSDFYMESPARSDSTQSLGSQTSDADSDVPQLTPVTNVEDCKKQKEQKPRPCPIDGSSQQPDDPAARDGTYSDRQDFFADTCTDTQSLTNTQVDTLPPDDDSFAGTTSTRTGNPSSSTSTPTVATAPSPPIQKPIKDSLQAKLPIPIAHDAGRGQLPGANKASTTPRNDPIPPFHAKRNLTLYTLNVRGMSSSIGDLTPMMLRYQPDIVALTETKHKGVKPVWRQALQGYKLIHKPPDTHDSTNRKRGGTILAIRQSAFKGIEALDPPPPLHNYIAAALLTPHAGKPILAVSAYMPQLRQASDKESYCLCIQWIKKQAQDHAHRTCYVGGDFQASPAPNLKGNARILREQLGDHFIPLNDPLTPTFQPAGTPVDHWLTRRDDRPPLPVCSSTVPSHHSDHSSLIVEIPAQATEHYVYTKPDLPRYSTRRPDTQFQFPLKAPHIREYQAGTVEIEQSIHNMATKINSLMELPSGAPNARRHIDDACSSVMDTLNSYLDHAKTVWPKKPPNNPHTTTKRHLPPLSRSHLRQLYRLTRLRNAARTKLRIRTSTRTNPRPRDQQPASPPADDTAARLINPTLPVHVPPQSADDAPHEYEYPYNLTSTAAQHDDDDMQSDSDPVSSAARTLNLEAQPDLQDIPTLCRQEIATIIKNANKKSDRKETERTNKAYDANPKQVHRNIKVASGLLPRSSDLPSLYGTRKPDGTVTTDPAEVIHTVESHFADELRTVTPAELPPPPWENPNNPDTFRLSLPYYEPTATNNNPRAQNPPPACTDTSPIKNHSSPPDRADTVQSSEAPADASAPADDQQQHQRDSNSTSPNRNQRNSTDTVQSSEAPTEDTSAPDAADHHQQHQRDTCTGNESNVTATGAQNLLNYANYVRTVTRLATGKAPGPDGIPNEVLRYLPDRMHSVIFGLFVLLAKHSYTPPSWGRSVTCLLFKHGKPDSMDPACYRPIALMNCILKLWTGTIQNALSAYAESKGIIRDSQDGFRALRKIYDSLTTHISMLEDAKIHGKDIYTCYIDFKSAFNGTDHRLLFQFMKDLGIPEKYIGICKQIYGNSKTAYATPYGLTRDLDINRGTLQGDTLSPFLFTLFLEPLLRWLQIGSRGYKPQGMGNDTGHSIHMTYDDHGYADDISITTGTLEDMKIQLQKIQLFSSYTGLELQIQKCEVTGALWSRGSPMAKDNLRHLNQQIDTIELLPGRKVKFLPPNASYKVLGVHLNHMLNFTEHFNETTKDVRKLIHTLQNFKLSGARKILVIDHMIIAKYHAMHLGLFSEQQLSIIDSMINSAIRKAQGLTPSFPTQALQAGRDNMGIDRPSVKARVTYLAAKHLVAMMNKPTQRGLWIYNHVGTLIKKFDHWPKEALNSSKYCNLPTLRVLTYIKESGITLRSVPPISSYNEIAHTIGNAMDAVNDTRWQRFLDLSDRKLDDTAYNALRKETQPLQARKNILSHLAPIWHLAITNWSHLVTRTAQGDLRMLGNSDIIKRAAAPPAPGEVSAVHKNLNTLRTLLQLPAETAHKTLPSAPTRSNKVEISMTCHPTWQAIIDPHIPEKESSAVRPTGYQILAEQAVKAASKKRHYAHQYEDHMVLVTGPLPPFDVLRISNRRRTVTLQTQYLIHWTPEFLTKQDIVDQEAMGFEIEQTGPSTGAETTQATKKLKPPASRKCRQCGDHLGGHPVTHCSSRNCHVAIHATCTQPSDDEWQCKECLTMVIPAHRKLHRVQWRPSWQSEQSVQTMPSGPQLITRYKHHGKRDRSRFPHRQTEMPAGWYPKFTTFSTHAINPDLDIHPTGTTELLQHHTREDLCVLARPDGTAAATLPVDTVHTLRYINNTNDMIALSRHTGYQPEHRALP